jgi:hydroxymethylpyrimidine/phosphomethylpyrimidine kinase
MRMDGTLVSVMVVIIASHPGMEHRERPHSARIRSTTGVLRMAAAENSNRRNPLYLHVAALLLTGHGGKRRRKAGTCLNRSSHKHTSVALTIAGSDSSGGAGIQADLKTFSALGIYGASAITAITAQNTFGVQATAAVDRQLVAQQIHAVLTDLAVGAIKTGMLFNEEIIEVVCATLTGNRIPLVVDPVMVATSGDRLLSASALATLKEKLIPMATLITPNLDEAAVLLDSPVAKSIDEMEEQANQLLKLGCHAVLLKGGHLHHKHSADILLGRHQHSRFDFEQLATSNTHGTGCTLSAAITAFLAQGADLRSAVTKARDYLHGALLHADELAISQSQTGETASAARHGPVHHFFRYWTSR